jgi:hypothetical protein
MTDLSIIFTPNYQIYKTFIIKNNKLVTTAMFSITEFDMTITHNIPDIFMIDHANKVVFIVEVSHPFDAFIETCYQSKFNKYMPLNLVIQGLSYRCQTIVLIIGSLGIVHRHFVPGLVKLGLKKTVAKAIAKFLSISCMIGSRRVWRRRRR